MLFDELDVLVVFEPEPEPEPEPDPDPDELEPPLKKLMGLHPNVYELLRADPSA